VGKINVAAGGITAEALVLDILAGRTGTAGLWSGTTGITSSVAAAATASPRAVGWIDQGGGALSVAFAAPGDTNIDGQCDILDAANLLSAGKYGSGEPANWSQGDFTYDGVVDILDVGDFLATGLYNTGPYLPTVTGAAPLAVVPEPGSAMLAGLAGIAGAACLRRRRSRVAAESGGRP
jgi:hypothetical protein